MEVQFKESNRNFHKVVEIGDEKFLLDTTTIQPKLYFFGGPANAITARMVKIGKRNTGFESAVPLRERSFSVSSAALGGSIDALLGGFFRFYDISHNIPVKIGFFVLSILLAYLMFWLFVFGVRHSTYRRLSKIRIWYQITFKPSGAPRQTKEYRLILMALLSVLVCFGFYMGIDNGTEGAILFINTFIFFGLFFLGLGGLSLRQCYERQEIVFEKIEEI